MGVRRKQRAAAADPGATSMDARVQRSRGLILQTTFELLVERGMGGMSVDEVSKRSGVAKTTIYRHWPTRAELVFEACSRVTSNLEPSDSGRLETDLTRLLLSLSRQLESAAWTHVLPSVVDASERDPDLAAALAQRQKRQSAPYLEAIQRAKGRGELAPKADASAMVARLVGPLFYRRWFTREPLDEAFVRAIVKGAIQAG